MQNEIVKHEKMMMVTMKDGRLLFFPASKDKQFYEDLKTEVLVKIQGVRVNKFEIKYVEPAPEKFDDLIFLDHDLKIECLERFEEFKSKLGYWPKKNDRKRLIEKIKQKSPCNSRIGALL